jgi:4-hydroxyphenylpyruvate dioxygenase-like putative hemolysin
VRSPDGGFRVVLNGSAATQTLVARFCTHTPERACKVFAFATDDIFDDRCETAAPGMEFLSIPAELL